MVFKPVAVVFGWSPSKVNSSKETAWLDGVRGVAAFLVLMNHYSMEWLTPFSDAPFGAVTLSNHNPDMVWYRQEGDRFWEPWRLPILRILMCSGNAQVAVFFVLSGFVLSWSPLRSARSDNYEKLYQSLGSSTIRRWFRLYLPCFVVSLAFLLHRIIVDYHDVLGIFEEIWHFLKGSQSWANPFETTRTLQFTAGHPYNYVMWTIPFEFAGSIFVYVLLLGFGRIRDYRRRTAVIVLVSLYALVSQFWGNFLFGSGLALADYIYQAGGFEKLSQRTSRLASCVWSLVFIVGLLFMGWPSPSEWYSRPGYEWTDYIPLPPGYRGFVGEGRFWWAWGGILVVSSACHLRYVRKFFELAIIQHLGRISFMLYLIHILINDMVTDPLKNYLYGVYGKKEFSETFQGDIYITTPIMNISIYCLLWVISVPIVMSLAHFLEVYVDRPCTNFGKWLDDKLVNGVKVNKIVPEDEERLLPSSNVAEVELIEVAQRE